MEKLDKDALVAVAESVVDITEEYCNTMEKYTHTYPELSDVLDLCIDLTVVERPVLCYFHQSNVGIERLFNKIADLMMEHGIDPVGVLDKEKHKDFLARQAVQAEII